MNALTRQSASMGCTHRQLAPGAPIYFIHNHASEPPPATHIRRDGCRAESCSALPIKSTVLLTRDGFPRYIGCISVPPYVGSRRRIMARFIQGGLSPNEQAPNNLILCQRFKPK